MAGHSKWANIKRRKSAQDAKRSKIFTKLIKEITVAAKEGGADPEANPRLRMAIQNAKGSNMPKDTIERAITKGSGSGAEEYHEVNYEGYAPNGVAIMVECTTENLNRTVSSVRSIFNKYGGSLGKNGSVDFLFEQKGVFVLPVPEGMDQEELELELIDAGAEEVEFNDGYMHITCYKEDFGSLQGKMEALNLEPETAELQRIPMNTVELDDENFSKVMKLIEALEDDDDVSKVWHNMEITESQMALF